MNRSIVAAGVMILIMGVTSGGAGTLDAGGDRLVDTQNADGGWDWPLLGSDDTVSDAPNLLAPTAMGLVAAWKATGDPDQLAALQRVGDYLLKKTPQEITPEDGYLAVALDELFAVTAYTDFVNTNFYDALAASSYDFYGDGSLLVDTSSYIVLMRLARDEQELPNLAAVDLGMGLYAAGLIGADTAPWIAGVKAEVNQLSSEGTFDVLGLAAAIFGLASVDEKCDPKFGAHADAASLEDLAQILAGYQLSTGGFTWNSGSLDEGAGHETAQETAFAIMALSRVSPVANEAEILRGAAYLEQAQLGTGGWENYAGGGECNEVTGEVLWSLAAAQNEAGKEGSTSKGSTLVLKTE